MYKCIMLPWTSTTTKDEENRKKEKEKSEGECDFFILSAPTQIRSNIQQHHLPQPEDFQPELLVSSSIL